MENEHHQERKTIAMIGGGFGGVACALELERLLRSSKTALEDRRIVLIDRQDYHLYTPLLYDAATTHADDGSPLAMKKTITTPLAEIVAGKRIEFRQATVRAVHVAQKEIEFDDNSKLPYEYLVFALGSQIAHFGIPGLKEHAISLKRLEDAIRIRAAIRRKHEEKGKDSELRLVVGGGGPTGVEFSCELTGYLREMNKKRGTNVRLAITIVEGAPSVLPGFEEWAVHAATERLASLGVTLKTGFMITRADENAVFIKKGPDGAEEQLPYDIFIWSGGVQAVSVVPGTELAMEKRGRMETDSHMVCASPDKHLDITQNVFAIGDNACFYNPDTHKPVPGTAWVAIQQGKVAAENIWRDINGQPRREFIIEQYPFVIPLGGKYALAKFGSFRMQGFLGWVMHELVELHYLLSITPFRRAFPRWWRGVEIFSKND